MSRPSTVLANPGDGRTRRAAAHLLLVVLAAMGKELPAAGEGGLSHLVGRRIAAVCDRCLPVAAPRAAAASGRVVVRGHGRPGLDWPKPLLRRGTAPPGSRAAHPSACRAQCTPSGRFRRCSASYYVASKPMTEALVSVILPVYNREASIERAIRSVLGQTYLPWHRAAARIRRHGVSGSSPSFDSLDLPHDKILEPVHGSGSTRPHGHQPVVFVLRKQRAG